MAKKLLLLILVITSCEQSAVFDSEGYYLFEYEDCKLFIRNSIQLDSSTLEVDTPFGGLSILKIEDYSREISISIHSQLGVEYEKNEYFYIGISEFDNRRNLGFYFFLYSKPTFTQNVAFSDIYI